jgi:acetyl-CoA carboxylase carboxyltransferase component
MGGPAMIEGGGLGVYRPQEVGPTSVQVPNGVIDLLVDDEEAATRAARQYLSYFQGPVKDWHCSDQRLLRQAIPENRLRVYDVRTVIAQLADEGSVMELRREFGVGILTAFIRVEGRPMGLMANNPMHLGGAQSAERFDVREDPSAGVGFDGNGVSVDREAVKIAANQLRYDTLAVLASQTLNGLAWAANDGRG